MEIVDLLRMTIELLEEGNTYSKFWQRKKQSLLVKMRKHLESFKI